VIIAGAPDQPVVQTTPSDQRANPRRALPSTSVEASSRPKRSLGAALLAAGALLLVLGTGIASAQPTIVAPANGASYPRSASSISFTVTIPSGATDATIQLSSSPATDASGALVSPSPLVYGLTNASGSYTWNPLGLFAAGTYYWQATSFVCETVAPFSCPGNEVSPVQSIVLTPLPPPAPVSPANGATQTVSASTQFVFTPNGATEDSNLEVLFSRSNAVGTDGVLSQPTSTSANLADDLGLGPNTPVSVPIPSALDAPGTIYWQPVRVNCYDNPTAPCNVAGPVSALTLKAKPPPPPPPLHLTLGGGTTVRIGTPRLAVTAHCSEACAGGISAKASVRVAGKTVADGLLDPRGSSFTAGANQPENFHYTYSGSALNALKHAVASHGYVQMTVIVTATANNGGGSAREERSIFVRPNPPPPPPPAPKTAPPPTPAPSSTLDLHDFSGNTLAVDAYLAADPATPANRFDKPSAGDRFVAIGLHLTDLGPGTISDDADGDTSLVGTNGQVYTPSFDGVQGCTNFDYGIFTLFDGESESGCVVFELPDSVGISRVAFTLGVNTAQWIDNG